MQSNKANVIHDSSESLNLTRIIVHSTSEHSSTRWSDRKLVGKEAEAWPTARRRILCFTGTQSTIGDSG